MKKATPRRSISERDAIFSANVRLVGSVVAKLSRDAVKALGGHDDATQIGYVALLHAATCFDESRGFQFSTYAATSIYRYLLRMLGDNAAIRIPAKRYREGERAPKLASGFDMASLKKAAPPEVMPMENDDLAAAMRKLPAINRTAIESKFWHHETIRVYALRLGITPQAGAQRLHNGVRRLRHLLKAS